MHGLDAVDRGLASRNLAGSAGAINKAL